MTASREPLDNLAVLIVAEYAEGLEGWDDGYLRGLMRAYAVATGSDPHAWSPIDVLVECRAIAATMPT